MGGGECVCVRARWEKERDPTLTWHTYINIGGTLNIHPRDFTEELWEFQSPFHL